jgi:hypothetical protein
MDDSAEFAHNEAEEQHKRMTRRLPKYDVQRV